MTLPPQPRVRVSKAFTKETDEDNDEPPASGPAAVGHNLITPAGLERLRAELQQLRRVERPSVVEKVSWAAGNGDRSENGDYIFGKRRLREIDSRMRFLGKRIEIAEPVDPARQRMRDQVFFGATVTYAEADGSERTVRIVGADEAGASEGDISWLAPVARALMKARVGEAVELASPSGPRMLRVVRIAYPGG